MFKEVREHFPDVARYVEAAYGQATILNFGDGSILSTDGAHQGDPLGPFLFSVTLQPVLEKLQEIEGVVQNTWFLDDGEVIGTREALIEVWDTLVREGVPRGFHLNPEKSAVFCPEHDNLDPDPLGRGVQRVTEGGIKLLGAPVGDRAYEDMVLRRRLSSVQDLVGELHVLDDPHSEMTLLRSCFAFPKFSYALRTVDTSHHQDILQDFDMVVKEAAEAILGAPLPPLQWD